MIVRGFANTRMNSKIAMPPSAERDADSTDRNAHAVMPAPVSQRLTCSGRCVIANRHAASSAK